MGTIEERAREYAHQYRRDAHDLKGERADAAFAAYCQGAEDERKELTAHYEAEIAAYQKVIKEGLEREKIAKDIIVEKRKEITRLTCWRDPKCPPAHRKPVLIKGVTPSGRKCLVVGVFYKSGLQTNTYYKVDPIGWREIHE